MYDDAKYISVIKKYCCKQNKNKSLDLLQITEL